VEIRPPKYGSDRAVYLADRLVTILTVTLNTYAHLWPTAEDRTRAAASMLAETLNPADSVRTSGRA